MKTSAREKNLLVVLGFILLVIIGLLGGRWFLHGMADRRLVLAQKTSELTELNIWLDSRSTWESRAQWLEDHPLPPFQSDSSANFVQGVQKSLANAGIETVDQQIGEAAEHAFTREVSMNLTLRCSLEQFVRWLYATQQPSAFRVARKVSLKSDVDDSKIRAEVTLAQLYSKSPIQP